jgi:hypothetical protein
MIETLRLVMGAIPSIYLPETVKTSNMLANAATKDR